MSTSWTDHHAEIAHQLVERRGVGYYNHIFETTTPSLSSSSYPKLNIHRASRDLLEHRHCIDLNSNNISKGIDYIFFLQQAMHALVAHSDFLLRKYKIWKTSPIEQKLRLTRQAIKICTNLVYELQSSFLYNRILIEQEAIRLAEIKHFESTDFDAFLTKMKKQ